MIKKSDLKLVSVDKLNTAPEPFNFNGEIDAELFSNILIDRMLELKGIGLSANQVGVNKKVFVMGNEDLQTAIFNPEIIEVSSETSTLDEGCLSFPGVYVKVNRPEKIKARFQNVKGELVEQEFQGLTARIFQHEYDHMLGKTMQDRVSKLKWDLASKRVVKRTKKIIRKHVQQQLANIQKQIDSK